MKRLLISAAATAALVTGLVLGLHSMRNLDPILEANVEALTSGEGFEYETGAPIVGTCGVLIGEGFFGKKYCQATIVICAGGGTGCNERRCPMHG